MDKLTPAKDTEIFDAFKNAEKKKYIVVDLSGGPDAERYPISWLDDVPEGGWTDEYKTTKLVLRRIEPGTFTMGSPKGELGRYDNETQHEVTLTNAYYIGVFETTQKQYELITGSNPSLRKGDVRPVEYVSYDVLRGKNKGSSWPYNHDVDEDSFFGKLRSKTNLIFDLPTEAQWEYACRAGTTTALNNGKDAMEEGEEGEKYPNMDEIGWYYYNSGDPDLDPDYFYYDNDDLYCKPYLDTCSIHPVGQKSPNAWGLYDMHGNVNEWCLDWYQDYLGTDPVTDPLGAGFGKYRVHRGGSWFSRYAYYCRSASRHYGDPDDVYSCYGFRVVLVH